MFARRRRRRRRRRRHEGARYETEVNQGSCSIRSEQDLTFLHLTFNFFSLSAAAAASRYFSPLPTYKTEKLK